MSGERIASIALIEVRRNPRLGEADPATLIGAILVSSQLGLELGPQGFAYLIPYWNKTRECFEVNFQLGYRGGMNLARRSGDVGLFTAEAAYENDDFWYRLGTENIIHHVPAMGDRGKPTYYYALARLISSGHDQFRVMSVSQVEEVRDRFSKSNAAGGFNPWRDNFEAMALKTTIIRNCKFLPTSAEVQKALTLDEMADAGVSQNLAAELPFDMEIPADFESQAAAEQMEVTADKIKADLGKAEHPSNSGINPETSVGFKKDDPEYTVDGEPGDDPCEPDDLFDEKYQDIDISKAMLEPDDFDVMDGEQLDAFLQSKHPAASKSVRKTIKSAIETDNLYVKREFARRMVKDA